MNVKIFADGADFDGILKLCKNPLVKGFTTNPSLMRKADVSDYEAFARRLLAAVPDKPISFEVIADDPEEMARQARTIASWGKSVNVKIPVTNTKNVSMAPLIWKLSREGIMLNVTALFTAEQVREVTDCLAPDTPAYVSVFAGRIADIGIDPLPMMRESVAILREKPRSELIWASPREVLNVYQADRIGCHIITATPDIIAKLSGPKRTPLELSLDAVKQFRADALAAGYSIGTEPALRGAAE